MRVLSKCAQVARMAAVAIACVVLSAGTPSAAWAQSRSPALERVRQLVEAGDEANARVLVDSILADSDPGNPSYVDALFWRASLAADPSDSRRELLRLVVEYPLSPRVSDALFQLSEREIEAGDTEGARRHLTRLVRDHASSASGSRGAYELSKLLTRAGDLRGACAALDSAYAYEPAGNVERRYQIAYAQRPCERLSALPASPGPVLPDSTSTGRGTGRPTPPVRNATPAGRATPPPEPRPSSATNSSGVTPQRSSRPAPAGQWSVQVAAFQSRAEATALAARLKTSGYDPRVTNERPFRVRIGRFATRAEAAALVTKLKSEKTDAIVVQAERP